MKWIIYVVFFVEVKTFRGALVCLAIWILFSRAEMHKEADLYFFNWKISTPLYRT